jgi:large subunit ribosomal protein L10
MTLRMPRASAPCAQLARLAPRASHPTSSTCAAAACLARSISTTAQRAAASPSGTPAPRFALPADYVPPKQPPSAKPTDTRKAQLIRTYTSLLRSTPVMLFFQHNNLDANQWLSIRRELTYRLSSVPAPAGCGVSDNDFNRAVRLQVLRTSMLRHSLKIHEFFDPVKAAADPAIERSSFHGPLVHDLSHAARRAVKDAEERELTKNPDSAYARLSPLLIGPLAALTIPAVSPAHLAAALSVLAPVPGKFPAPLRRKRPEYWNLPVQMGLQKLLLIGGRIETRVMDTDSIGWVAGIEGGVDSIRAEIVHLLNNAGLGLVNTIDSSTRNLWFTLESRRTMLEDESKPKETAEGGEGGETVESPSPS